MSANDRERWAQLMDEMHQQHRENEREAIETTKRVRNMLLEQHCAFLKDFTEAEKRLFGVVDGWK